MKQALVVIDMQGYFEWGGPTWAKVRKNVHHEITLAKKRKAPIIIVRLSRCGPVMPCILKKVANYEKAVQITKYDQDGSRGVISALKKLKVKVEHLRVCGIYQSMCVFDTVCGLLERTKARISVAVDACADDVGTEWWGYQMLADQFPYRIRYI
jgi:nicotinamidase-related amidase